MLGSWSRKVFVGLFIVGLIAAILTHGGATTATPQASPVASPEASPALAEWIKVGISAATPQQEVLSAMATPGVLPSLNPQRVAMTRVTLQPGGEISPSRPHQGSSVLYVESGTLCFTVLDATAANLQLFRGVVVPDAPMASPMTGSSTCSETVASCDAMNGCDIGTGDVIVLYPGDVVTTTIAPESSVLRGYRNIGSDVAIILIADLQTSVDGFPCGGGCP